MTEVWKPIPGFEGHYEASDQGRVRSLTRRVAMRDRWGNEGTTLKHGRVIAPSRRKDGYLHVSLYVAGECSCLLLHRVILETFVGPPPSPAHQGCHGNKNTRDNRLKNLRWDTPAGNNADKLRHGTLPRGETSATAKLTEQEVLAIRERQGEPQAVLAAEFGCTFSNISAIQRRKSWRHV